MSSLSNTPTRRLSISQAPRAELTISMDAEREGAIPLAELADIARSVQQTIDRIVRALNDRSGRGRPLAFLKKLSALEAVGIEPGSAVLVIEAPHDMAQFPIEFDEADAGAQAVQLFVSSLDALARGESPPEEIGDPAAKSIRGFLRAVGGHESVKLDASVGDLRTTARFDPRLVDQIELDTGEQPESPQSIKMVGRLYAVNIENHTYRVKDEMGRKWRVRISDDLDDRMLARMLIGETIHVTADRAAPGDEHAGDLVARTIERVAPPEASEYYSWDLESALEKIEPLVSIDDLAIPGLTEEEADAFWEAINE